MYIIVVGAGKVGYYLVKTLLAEGHEVLVIERDAKKCERTAEELGSVVMRGDGCEARTLDNLVACQIAKQKFNVGRTIARINNPKNETIFKKLGIDTTVSSTNLILEHIEQEVPTHPLIHLLTLKMGGLEIVDVKIPTNSAVVGKRLRDISLPPDSVLAVVIDPEAGAQVPTADTVLRAEDQVIAVTKTELEGALRAALTGM